MRTKTIIPTFIFTLLVAIVLVAAWASTPAKNNTSKECLEDCSKKGEPGGPANVIWEPLSHQFFSAVKAN
ncbi:MAG: hypothetical protein JSU05_03105 [Bacteroidetes bacterium]|nr:hypothetical protein [Bacteroidota bacterium]